MMSRFTTLFVITLLLCSTTLSFVAARPLPDPAFPAKTQHLGIERDHVEVVDESCEGVGEEECLMRRTLAAHIDYIYTQKQKP